MRTVFSLQTSRCFHTADPRRRRSPSCSSFLLLHFLVFISSLHSSSPHSSFPFSMHSFIHSYYPFTLPFLLSLLHLFLCPPPPPLPFNALVLRPSSPPSFLLPPRSFLPPLPSFSSPSHSALSFISAFHPVFLPVLPSLPPFFPLTLFSVPLPFLPYFFPSSITSFRPTSELCVQP